MFLLKWEIVRFSKSSLHYLFPSSFSFFTLFFSSLLFHFCMSFPFFFIKLFFPYFPCLLHIKLSSREFVFFTRGLSLSIYSICVLFGAGGMMILVWRGLTLQPTINVYFCCFSYHYCTMK